MASVACDNRFGADCFRDIGRAREDTARRQHLLMV
jgi:hypothetical protein